MAQADKGACCQAIWPDYDPQATHGRSLNLSSALHKCTMTCLTTQTHVHTHKHKHMQFQQLLINKLATQYCSSLSIMMVPVIYNQETQPAEH